MHRSSAALVAALGVALVACGPERPPNVVLIVVDTLRADRLSVYGYPRPTTPNLERLADESVVFDDALTVMSHTLPAHVSLLTGVHPTTHQVLSNGWVYEGAWPTLAARLRGAGYATAAFVSGFPLVRRSGLASGFQVYEDVVIGGRNHSKVEGELTNRRVLRWLRATPPQPFFLMVHYFDTHTPYTWPEPGPLPLPLDAAFQERFERDGLAGLEVRDVKSSGIAFRGAEIGLAEAGNVYDNLVLRVDGLIGELLDELRSQALLDDTLLVVTSDHGEGLGQHGYYSHGLHLYEEQLRIPLIVRPPRGAGWQPGRSKAAVSLLDVVPTVLELAGLPARDGLHGRSLSEAAAGELPARPRYLVAQRRHFPRRARIARGEFASSTDLHAVRGDGRLKYLRDGSGKEELYDLEADPSELRNLVETRVADAEAFRRRLEERLAALDPGRPVQEPDLDEETRRRLEELGYAQ